MGKAIFLLVFVDGPDSKSVLGTASAEAEIGTKLPPTPVADAHDLLEIGFALFFLGLNKDQSLQAFCASTASTNFKDVFERMKIISPWFARLEPKMHKSCLRGLKQCLACSSAAVTCYEPDW